MKHLLACLLLLLGGSQLAAHCQVPCGIYHDQMVVKGMEEDIETLMKAVSEIQRNARVDAQDYNQLVRWVMNKEKHADKLADTIVEYFLKQRIKPSDEHVEAKVTTAHKILVLTMKAKQTVDPVVLRELHQEYDRFVNLMYPPERSFDHSGAHDHGHGHEHGHDHKNEHRH